MVILSLSAVFIGFMHSLAHGLPVVLMAKARKWSIETAMLGALVTAAGHILMSLLVGLTSMWVGVHFLAQYENQIEKVVGLVLGFFGMFYSIYSYRKQMHCHGHSHSNSIIKQQKAPFIFLFSLGFSPCVAVLPLLATALSAGSWVTLVALASYSGGVLVSLLGSTLVVTLGLVRWNHRYFDHYGDVITGSGVALVGVMLFLTSLG